MIMTINSLVKKESAFSKLDWHISPLPSMDDLGTLHLLVDETLVVSG